METVNIFGNIHYVGTHDSTTHLFENNCLSPTGVSFNSYVVPS